MLVVRASPVAARIRAVFGNLIACNIMATCDRSSDEPPSSEQISQWPVRSGQRERDEAEAEPRSSGLLCGIFRSNRSRWFSGLSWLALGQSQGGSHSRRCEIFQNKPTEGQSGLP